MTLSMCIAALPAIHISPARPVKGCVLQNMRVRIARSLAFYCHTNDKLFMHVLCNL